MSDEVVREAFERKAKAVMLRPGVGQKTVRTSARLKPGLECRIEEGPWTLTAGMSESNGGNNAGPSPGFYGRGALGSCLAIGIGMWAARLGVRIDDLTVTVEADYDSRGELGVSDEIPPGYTEVRCTITVVSSAPEADVRRVIATAEKYSPYKDVFARATPLRTELHIAAPSA
jgi:uncharacterized OsmC-like protein